MTNQNPKIWYGPIAMQKRRLAQVESLIEQYTRLIRDAGDYTQFSQALERARQQRARLQNWLSIHEKGHVDDHPPETVQTAMASLVH